MKTIRISQAASLIAALALGQFTLSGQEGKDDQPGKLTYENVTVRDGGIVMKDVHDSFEGDGWIAGTVVRVGSGSLIVSVPKGRKREYTVSVDRATSVCAAKSVAPNSLAAIGELKPGERVSVLFRKGTLSAERIVDQSYEIVSRMNGYGLSATAGGPSMPHCD